jgi:hypothetical protein
MIHAVEPAADVVGRLVVEAEVALARRSALLAIDDRA